MINLFSSDAQRVTIVREPFKGTPLVPVSSYSWRKIFGIYEHVLNKWLESFVPHIEVVWDVGANDGYFCYGCAHRILEHRGQAVVVAFEPGIEHDDCFLLEAPPQWVVEIHGDSLLQPGLQHFAVAGRKTEVIQPQPHWMMGREQRTIRTCWAVTV